MTAGNILTFCDGVDLIVDGTDNFETRFLLNEAALRSKIPWIYGGAIGATGQTMTILPERTAVPALRDSRIAAARQLCRLATRPAFSPRRSMSSPAFKPARRSKFSAAIVDAVNRGLTVVDLWDNRFRQVGLSRLAEQGCPTCRGDDFPWLAGRRGSQTAVLCGRNAVQLAASTDGSPHNAVSLDALEEKLNCDRPH